MRSAVLFIILISVVGVAGKHLYLSGFWYTEPYTYDGEFNPYELYEWEREIVDEISGRDLYKCYNSDSPIKDVLVLSKRKGVFEIFLYSYVKDDVKYINMLEWVSIPEQSGHPFHGKLDLSNLGRQANC